MTVGIESSACKSMRRNGAEYVRDFIYSINTQNVYELIRITVTTDVVEMVPTQLVRMTALGLSC